MEKSKFVEVADIYYGVAIALYYTKQKVGYSTKAQIQAFYSPNYTNIRYLENDAVFNEAAKYLAKEGIIRIIQDDFGPSLYQKTDDSSEIILRLMEEADTPWFKYKIAGQSWLESALLSLNKAAKELGIEAGDFEKTDHEWAPIPLDRDEPLLLQAQEAVQQTLDELRADNGYNIAHPEEKDYVSEKLGAFVSRMKSGSQVSWMYVKNFAIEPLTILVKRFGQAAIGISAAAARAAIVEWLKKHGLDFLDSIWK